MIIILLLVDLVNPMALISKFLSKGEITDDYVACTNNVALFFRNMINNSRVCFE